MRLKQGLTISGNPKSRAQPLQHSAILRHGRDGHDMRDMIIESPSLLRTAYGIREQATAGHDDDIAGGQIYQPFGQQR